MVHQTAGVLKTCFQVARFKIGHLLEDLLGAQTRGKKVQNVTDPNPGGTHAGASPALLGVDGDSFQRAGHAENYPRLWRKLNEKKAMENLEWRMGIGKKRPANETGRWL
jgi:hypothetical protein